MASFTDRPFLLQIRLFFIEGRCPWLLFPNHLGLLARRTLQLTALRFAHWMLRHSLRNAVAPYPVRVVTPWDSSTAGCTCGVPSCVVLTVRLKWLAIVNQSSRNAASVWNSARPMRWHSSFWEYLLDAFSRLLSLFNEESSRLPVWAYACFLSLWVSILSFLFF